MKKIFLIASIVVASTLQSLAHKAGDYVYTRNGRYKLTTAVNLLPNGNFASGTDGWTADGTAPLSKDRYEISDYGPDGAKALSVIADFGKPTNGGAVLNGAKVEASKRYVAVYSVMSAGSVSVTEVTADKDNYQNVYFNTDGTTADATAEGFVQIAFQQSYTNSWTDIAYDFVPVQDGYINFYMYRLPMGENFANFGVYEATRVADDREVKALITEIDALLANPLFANERESLVGAREALVAALDTDSYDEVAALIDAVRLDAITGFLDANTLNVSEYLTCPDFDEAAVSKNQQTLIGGAWEAEGGRWLVRAAGDIFATTYVERSIPGDYKLEEGRISQTVDLPAGKYMFTMNALAQRYKSKKNDIDELYDMRGISVFINDTKAECTPVYTYKPGSYTVIADVPEGEKLTVGAYIPAGVANYVLLDGTELRLIGGKAEDVDNYFNAQKMVEARRVLRLSIDSAKVMAASDMYFYGKKVLSDSIAIAEDAYANGDTPDYLALKLKHINRAISEFLTLNAEYVAIATAIAEAEALAVDNRYTAGKAELNAAVATARAFINTLDVNTPNPEGITAACEVLLKAVAAFYNANASYATPGMINVVNPDFTDQMNGWIIENASAKAYWKAAANDKFKSGYALTFSRGETAHEGVYAGQDVEVEAAGLYELTADVIARNTKASLDGEQTGVYLELADSRVLVHTGENPQSFAVRFVAEAPQTLRIAMNARENALCNNIMFGNVRLKYYGDYNKYVADSLKAELAPSLDALAAKISEAETLAASVRNPNGVSTAPFDCAIAAARQVYAEGSDANTVTEAVKTLDAAINEFMLSGVWPKEGEAFDLTFAIDNAALSGNANGWTVAGDRLADNKGYLKANYGTDAALQTRMWQVVSGLPQGKFEFMADATYRLKLTESFNYADYEATEPVFIVAGQDSTQVKGLLTDADEDYVKNVLKLTLDDYRHGDNFMPMFESGLFLNKLEFYHADNSDVELALSAIGMPRQSGLFVAGFKLLFWGDNIGTGITAPAESNAAGAAAPVYSLTGVKVRAAATSLSGLLNGIYIYKGKKVTIR